MRLGLPNQYVARNWQPELNLTMILKHYQYRIKLNLSDNSQPKLKMNINFLISKDKYVISNYLLFLVTAHSPYHDYWKTTPTCWNSHRLSIYDTICVHNRVIETCIRVCLMLNNLYLSLVLWDGHVNCSHATSPQCGCHVSQHVHSQHSQIYFKISPICKYFCLSRPA